MPDTKSCLVGNFLDDYLQLPVYCIAIARHNAYPTSYWGGTNTAHGPTCARLPQLRRCAVKELRMSGLKPNSVFTTGDHPCTL